MQVPFSHLVLLERNHVWSTSGARTKAFCVEITVVTHRERSTILKKV